MTRGLIVAAPASGGGKTTVTLGLVRHFHRAAISVASAKVGPDYIDPAFHAAAGKRPCLNLDTWAMRPSTVDALLRLLAADADLVVVEGVMGLFDGARGARDPARDGSTAALAAMTGWPTILVIDAPGQGASAAAVVRGFATHRSDVRLAGVIFNRVGGPRHEAVLRDAMAAALPAIPVLGCLPTIETLALPSRHLGLVQAREHPDLPAFLDRAADAVAAHLDLDRLTALAAPVPPMTAAAAPTLAPPLGGRIAVARDDAFAFAYPALLDGWRAAGASLSFFSPLADETPDPAADALYLPGGYPELHAGRLAAATAFLTAVRGLAGRGATVFGECGGYMTLGETLTDGQGTVHAMAGLLPLASSFAVRERHLGYRRARLLADGPLGAAGAAFRGHEFHYATARATGGAAPLFAVQDAAGSDLGPLGMRAGSVMGSFIHLIDREEAT